MADNKDTIIKSLCSTIERQEKLIKSLEGEIDYYKIRVEELGGKRYAGSADSED